MWINKSDMLVCIFLCNFFKHYRNFKLKDNRLLIGGETVFFSAYYYFLSYLQKDMYCYLCY